MGTFFGFNRPLPLCESMLCNRSFAEQKATLVDERESRSATLPIASRSASSRAASILRRIPLVIFHVQGHQGSNRILPRRNPAVSTNQFACVIVIAVAIIV